MKEYKAGAYLRLSKEDDNPNNSISAQREIILNYAKKNNFNVVKEYVDNGWSGILDSRPALNEMILDILKNKIDMLIVKDLSRLTRDKNKTGYYTEIFFPDNDVRFIAINDYIDSGERYEIDDTIMLKGIINQSYLKDVSKKIKSVIRNKKEEGKFVQHYTPYGYKKDENDKYKLIIDDKVSYNIKLIFKMYLEGFSQGQIAKELTRRGVDTPKKYKGKNVKINEWRNDTISRILKDPTYKGALVLNKYETDYMTKKTSKTPKKDWIIKEDTHEAIIDKETFNKVQEMLENKFVKPNQKYNYLLKDLVYCKNCGAKMQYKSRARTKIHNKKLKNPQLCWYFKCRMVYRFPSVCDKGYTISEKTLNEIVISSLNKRLSIFKFDGKLDEIISRYKKNDDDYINELRLQNQKLRTENDIRILYNQKLEQNIDIEVFKKKYEILKTKEKKIENKIEELKEKNKDKISVQKLVSIIKEFKNAENFDNETMKQLINKVEIGEDKTVSIIFNF